MLTKKSMDEIDYLESLVEKVTCLLWKQNIMDYFLLRIISGENILEVITVNFRDLMCSSKINY